MSQPGTLSLLATRTITAQPFKSARSCRPTFSIRQVTPRLGGRRIRSSLGTIWQLPAVPRRPPKCLKIRWIRCTKFDIYVAFQGLIKNSKSVDFGLPSPGFVTHGPILLTLFVRTVPRPWFNCPVHVRLVPSPLARPVLRLFRRLLLFHPITARPPAAQHRAKFPNSGQRQPITQIPNVGLRRPEGPLGVLSSTTRDPRDTRPDAAGPKG